MTLTNGQDGDNTVRSQPTTRLPNVADIVGSKNASFDPRFDPDQDLGLVILPDVVGYYMLVALPTPKEATEGGIIIPDETTQRERAASIIGKVLDMGRDCYTGTFPNGMPRYPNGPWCKPGDIVMFARYKGIRFRVEGVEYRVLSDDEIVATVPDGAEVSGL